ncbi:MAG TPA: BON domain-containing protein [Nitrospira sp.]|nr:BON domain-containing protein [Nitrospira sp.]
MVRVASAAFAVVFACAVWLPAASGHVLVQDRPETMSDAQLQTAVTRVMQISPLTANSLIVVHVRQGEVTLEGAATSALARREATRLAETVFGVREVHNRLSVINQQTAEPPAGG